MVRVSRNIRFHFACPAFYFPNRTKVKVFLVKLFRQEGYKLQAVNYIFCTDDYLLEFNQDYLRHNTYTDIITFGLSEKDEPLIADIYISVERVKENSRLFGVTFVHELHRVIFHGALHLCGYKDKSPAHRVEMRSKEDHYLKAFFVSRETRATKS
jgi:probable rRNA maturation factor